MLVFTLATGCGRYWFDALASDGEDGGAGDTDGLVAEACDDITGALACTSFESGGMLGWNLENGNGSISTSCPTPHSGEHCLVVATDGGGAASRALYRYSPQGAGSQLFARLYVRLDPAADIAGITVATLDAEDSGIDGPNFDIVDNGRFELSLEEVAGGLSPIASVPRGEWFCLHLAMDVDDANGSVTTGFDDAQVSRSPIDTFPNGPYDYVAVGVDWSSPQQEATTVMIDDVVVATAPVLCQ